MPIASKKDFYDFLRTSKKFCRQVDKYSAILGLSEKDIDNYKNDNRFLASITSPEKMDDAWDEKWMHNKVENLHVAFAHLVHVCKNSPNYSVEIGIELGIEASAESLVAVACR